MSDNTLSPQQRTALTAIARWWDDPNRKQVFRLFGYAGTGKTTIARRLPGMLGLAFGELSYAAFTGKAAGVLRTKGCDPASTIHSLIYKPAGDARAELHEARTELARCADPVRRAELEALVVQLERDLDQPSFILDRFGLDGIELLVIDEVSMIDDRMGADLVSFGAPLLVLGDPAQLPPVTDNGGDGYFMRDRPDVILTEVHRQQADSPVLDLATRIREGRGTTSADYYRGSLPIEVAAMDNGQVLVGRNATRWDVNVRVRRALGRQYGRPERGDRVVCLANNRELGVYNGQVCIVDDVRPAIDPFDEWAIELLLNDADTARWLRVSLLGFIDEESERTARRQAFRWKDKALFTWAYALTTHKAQGSQWPHVFVIDESSCFRESAVRWLYTGVTRASATVTLGSADNFH